MNVEEVGAATMAGAMPLGVPPSPYKRPPSPPLKAHLLVKDLSPPLEFIPHGLRLARYMFWWLFGKKELCFRCIAGARRRRLLGASNVCASTDALLICGARTSSRS